MSLIDRLRRPSGSGAFVAEIDGLRFFAILPVVLDHAWWTYRANVGDPGFALESPLGRVFSAGELGVQLFFVISGYVLGLGFFRAAKERRGVGLGRYFVRRLRRLEPPFILIMTIFFVLLVASGRFGLFDGLGHYLASITYLHGLIYLEPSPINTVTWSLEVELQFYVLAPALYAIYRLEPRLAQTLFAGGMLVFIATAYLVGDFYLTLLSHGHLFLLGAAFPLLGRFEIPARLAFVFPTALLVYFLIEADYASVWGNLAKIVLLTAIFATTLGCAPVRRFLSMPFLFVVGGACYSIYLIHYPLLSAFSKIWAATSFPGGCCRRCSCRQHDLFRLCRTPFHDPICRQKDRIARGFHGVRTAPTSHRQLQRKHRR
ncbi:acyltransferase family protein [Thalassobacter stenotrophicus]|uniref:O-acetyltransferase OatA n=2 Tax=Thalassobacter stenotrophicus TaxID=266809 RepID=A0A0P1FMZ3_9RHOB|nr:acyltransferase [Thalassobacter stenotrophicus]CUH61443.1 O-acetyltransferase OatA [Thalassobacter stenotrophicus]SHJ09690.1 Peptidoglycan/LPS O-acetylase OafA/YrhL, contains acyltransferase and SGNH-hydrolase domains [Thalassobacter stenotrophicus DSM 16310]